MSVSAPSPEMRNLVIAIGLSMAVLLGWQYWIEQPKREAAQARIEKEMQEKQALGMELPDAPLTPEQQQAKLSERLETSPRLPIQTKTLSGSISQNGLRLDDLVMNDYREHVDPTSDPVRLLAPAAGADSYFVDFGWLTDDASLALPDASTQWNTSGERLNADESVAGEWDNAQGLEFAQKISLDKHYMFTIRQRVTNRSDKPVTLYPYGLINRTYADDSKHFYILHEGPIGVFNDTLEEVEYETLRDEGAATYSNSKGWLGITDKYWLAALIPDSKMTFDAKMRHTGDEKTGKYQVDFTGSAQIVKPGETIEVTHRLFAGAKQVALLDEYAAEYSIPLFDRAIDFGMFYFLTKPIFHALNYFYHLLGNFGLAIMLLTVCIKLALFPLANKSYAAMGQLKKLMPKIQEIKERSGDDKLKMNQEIMELYKREKVNPASGCLPILIQIPIFFSLYKVLFVTIEMRHADFYGWVNDLSAQDPTTLFNLFGLIPWDPPSFLMIGAWPIIMCVTMVIQQQLNPKPTDPAQAIVMKWLPFIFLFLFATFPAGLVIYWAWNNTLSILQQWLIMRRHRTS